jgi:hypothetical protein
MAEALTRLVSGPAERQEAEEWWLGLTTLREKFLLYAVESYFRESWLDACTELGAQRFQVLQSYALVIFRPDAVVFGRIERALALLSERGFVPVLARQLQLDRLNTRELWRYQWNAATVDRLAVCELLTAATPSVLIMLRDAAPLPGIPASVRLARLKGSPQPWERRPGDLRTELRSSNRMITFIHVADEPADLVRELGILFDRAVRRSIFATLRKSASLDATGQALGLARKLTRKHPPVALDPHQALGRVLQAVEEAAATGAPAEPVDALRRHLQGCRSGKSLAWLEFADALRAAGAEPRLWDLILVGAEWIVTHEEQPAILDGDICLQAWTAEPP